jgi:hypothetical protein
MDMLLPKARTPMGCHFMEAVVAERLLKVILARGVVV